MEPIDQNSILIPIDLEQINPIEERKSSLVEEQSNPIEEEQLIPIEESKNSGGEPIHQRENWISF
jgi:hypothetical protein